MKVAQTPPAAGPGGDHRLTVEYLRVLYKRRRSAMTVCIATLTLLSVRTLTTTPVYEATTQILIDKENSNVINFKEAFEQNQNTDDYYQTQYRILRSRGLARRTIAALHLADRPEFRSPPAPRLSLAQAVGAGIRLFRRLAPENIAPEPPLGDETARDSALIDHLLGGLTIAPVHLSRLVDVRYRSTNAALAAEIVNSLASTFIEQNLEFKFTASKEASDWLGQRLAEQRKQVEVAEQALQRYREQTDAVSLEDRQNIVVQKLADLNTAVTKAKTERIQKETAYAQIRSLKNDRAALDTAPAILSNGFIQQQRAELADLQRQQAQLSEKLGPNHPDMVKITTAIRSAEAKIQLEVTKVVASMRNDYEANVSQERSLTTALNQQKQEALELNRKSIDYGVLQRDAATSRQIFDSLLQRAKETGISGELKTSNIRVIDRAEVSQAPVVPNTQRDLAFALITALGCGLGVAFFWEYFDNRIKTPDEITEHLGLPFLGLVPALFGRGADNPLINNGAPMNFSESFRIVRTNVLFSSAHDGGRSIAVTSTGPGEGKTLVAANLAIALAQSGHRVLLLDADMRRNRAHEIFDRPAAPGLSNVLVGTARPSHAVKPTSTDGLWLLPAGQAPPNPAELLGSQRFRDFLASLQRHFDWVVVDTPPVAAVTDSTIAANLVTGVVFVVGSEMTSRFAARRAVDQLRHAKVNFVGAVLNRVDLDHHAYYYSHYYRREYSSYYATS